MMKPLALTLFALVSASAFASPSYPWQQSNCSSIQQGDGKQIGAVCSENDNTAGVGKIVVYYTGYLMDNNLYSALYANLSLNGAFFARRGMQLATFGDNRNLPETQALTAEYVATTNFNTSFPTGADFKIYFQAEEKMPQHSPPFSYDNLFGQNYAGTIKQIQF